MRRTTRFPTLPHQRAATKRFNGHDRFDATSDIYAPFDPVYLGMARVEIERIIEEIMTLAPGAFRRTDAELGAEGIPLSEARSA